MNDHRPLTVWCLVVAFAVGMAWVESASVYYLRTAVDRIQPHQANPLPISAAFGPVELVREAATLVMLFAVGAIAGRTWHHRLAYTAIAFGVWDILYYAFLRIMTDWPQSLFDWDVLFLLPLPWWGPVLAPVSIAALMILWGTLATQFTDRGPMTAVRRNLWGASALGIGLALYVFMADSVHLLHQGIEATRQVLPQRFNWPLFLTALALMSMPVVEIGWRIRSLAVR
jgi:hypothetical protein